MSDFPVMLASPSKMIDRIRFPAFAQTKMDGMRANIIIENKRVTVYSRNGKPMNVFGRFDPLSDHIDNMMLDGELLVQTAGKILDRKTGNGILHKAVVGTISFEESMMISIVLWDAVHIDFWRKGMSMLPYVDRLKTLRKIPETNLHSIVDTFVVNDLTHAQDLFKRKLAEGEEGIILKNMDHPWEDRRSPNLVKMKEWLEMDLQVIDWVEGTGKYTGMMGALTCANRDRSLIVSVGTGFTDAQRKEFTRKNTVGKIVSIKYTAMINRKSDNVKSLFLPVFVEFRPDKDEPDL